MPTSFAIPMEAARITVSTSFFMSALWKSRHTESFRLAYRSVVPRRYFFLDRHVLHALAVTELVLGVGLLGPDPISQCAAFIACGMLGTFLIVVSRQRDTTSGCGCWGSTRPVPRSVYVARNSLLLAAAVLAAIPTEGELGSATAVAVALGITSSILIMSIPQVVGVLHPIDIET